MNNATETPPLKRLNIFIKALTKGYPIKLLDCPHPFVMMEEQVCWRIPCFVNSEPFTNYQQVDFSINWFLKQMKKLKESDIILLVSSMALTKELTGERLEERISMAKPFMLGDPNEKDVL